MSAFHFDLFVRICDQRFSIENPHLVLIQIEIVQPGFFERRRRAISHDSNVVLRMNFRHLDHRVSAIDSNLGIRQAGRDHLDRRIVAEPQKHAGGQQNFHFPSLRRQRLSRLQLGGADRLRIQRLSADRGLSFNIIKRAWGRCAPWRRINRPCRRQECRGQDEQRSRFQPKSPHFVFLPIVTLLSTLLDESRTPLGDKLPQDLFAENFSACGVAVLQIAKNFSAAFS